MGLLTKPSFVRLWKHIVYVENVIMIFPFHFHCLYVRPQINRQIDPSNRMASDSIECVGIYCVMHKNAKFMSVIWGVHVCKAEKYLRCREKR